MKKRFDSLDEKIQDDLLLSCNNTLQIFTISSFELHCMACIFIS